MARNSAKQDDEDLDPLFSYQKTQPFVTLDDDEEEALPRRWQMQVRLKKLKKGVTNVQGNEENASSLAAQEDDWLPPPPKFSGSGIPSTNATLEQLRQKRAELLHIASAPSPAAIMPASSKDFQPVEASATSQAVERGAATSSSKIRIFVQDKDGNRKQYGIRKEDKLEKLFSAYAISLGLKMQNFVFRFDGQQLDPSSTVEENGIEDEEQIEVFPKTA